MEQEQSRAEQKRKKNAAYRFDIIIFCSILLVITVNWIPFVNLSSEYWKLKVTIIYSVTVHHTFYDTFIFRILYIFFFSFFACSLSILSTISLTLRLRITFHRFAIVTFLAKVRIKIHFMLFSIHNIHSIKSRKKKKQKKIFMYKSSWKPNEGKKRKIGHWQQKRKCNETTNACNMKRHWSDSLLRNAHISLHNWRKWMNHKNNTIHCTYVEQRM